MSLQLQQVDAGAPAEQIDMAAMITCLNDARRELNFIRAGYQNESEAQQQEIATLRAANATQAQELMELEADREVQAEDLDAAFATHGDAYNELRIAYNHLMEDNSAQRTKFAALEAELVRQKADNQSASEEVAALRSVVASQDHQALKDLQLSHDDLRVQLDATSAELIGVYADKEAQAAELAQLKVTHQNMVEQLAHSGDSDESMSAQQSDCEDESASEAEVSSPSDTQSVDSGTQPQRAVPLHLQFNPFHVDLLSISPRRRAILLGPPVWNYGSSDEE